MHTKMGMGYGNVQPSMSILLVLDGVDYLDQIGLAISMCQCMGMTKATTKSR